MQIIFVNGKSECGCHLDFSDGEGSYSDVHTITLCSKHKVEETSKKNTNSNLNKFDIWFNSIEAGDDPEWEVPAYLSIEWYEYLHRRQLALGAWLESSKI